MVLSKVDAMAPINLEPVETTKASPSESLLQSQKAFYRDLRQYQGGIFDEDSVRLHCQRRKPSYLNSEAS